jgi:type I restriction enzyme S subunit
MKLNESKIYKFNDLAEIIGGGTPNTKIKKYWDGDINWISIYDINISNRYIYDTEKKITKNGLSNSSAKLIDKDDIVISARGTVGLIAQLSKPMAFNQSCYGIKAKKDLIDKNFLFYLLKNNINLLKSRTHGSVFDTITMDTLKNLEVIIPQYNTQILNAKILSSLDDKIEANKMLANKLEELAQTLYKRWFVDFEFPNEEGKPYKSSGGEMVESELGLIPEGWEVLSLGEVLKENIRGFSPKYTQDKKNGIPVINQRCLRNHTITEEAVQYHDNKLKLANLKFYHKEWDVLINSMGVGTLGRVSISSISSNRLVHSCISILRNNEKVKKGFFSFLILSLENKFVAMGEGTTGQTSLNNKEIAKIKVIIPGLKVQEKNDDIFINLVAKIDSNNSQNKKLSELRDLLLPKLMSGEIEVQDME